MMFDCLTYTDTVIAYFFNIETGDVCLSYIVTDIVCLFYTEADIICLFI